jgi:hypothetical protein
MASPLFAQANPPKTEWAIGFFSKANADGTITVLASYKSWTCEVVDKKQLDGVIPGDLVEFEFWMKGQVVVIVTLVNHKMPGKEELAKLLEKYGKK